METANIATTAREGTDKSVSELIPLALVSSANSAKGCHGQNGPGSQALHGPSKLQMHLTGTASQGSCMPHTSGWDTHRYMRVDHTPQHLSPPTPAVLACTSDTTTVKRPESPSLPRHQGCLFHLGDLVAHRHLELQRVLGGQGDLEGPRRRRAIEHRQNAKLSPKQKSRGHGRGPPHLPSGPRPLSRPSLPEVPADPENRKSQACVRVCERECM